MKWIWDLFCGDDSEEILRDLRFENAMDKIKEKNEIIAENEKKILSLQAQLEQKDKQIEGLQGHNAALAEKWNRIQQAVSGFEDGIDEIAKKFRQDLRKSVGNSDPDPIPLSSAVVNQIKSSARNWAGPFHEKMRIAFNEYMDRIRNGLTMMQEEAEEPELVENPAPKARRKA